jgi:hypothetical protein
MKLVSTLLPLVAVTSAFVIPDERIASQLAAQKGQTFLDRLQSSADNVWSGIEESFKDVVTFSGNAIDDAFIAASDAKATFECYMSMTKFEVGKWLDSAKDILEDNDFESMLNHPGHKKPKHPGHRDPHHGPPHHGPPHHHNKTVYELIASSKYTTKLAELINEYPDLVKTLNGTEANYTVFAPIDKAFDRIPKGHGKPSKELIKKVLAYHISPDFYPAGRVLLTHTIPSALGEDALGGKSQRLRVGLGLKGLAINFYSHVIAVDIVGPLATALIVHANSRSLEPMESFMASTLSSCLPHLLQRLLSSYPATSPPFSLVLRRPVFSRSSKTLLMKVEPCSHHQTGLSKS